MGERKVYDKAIENNERWRVRDYDEWCTLDIKHKTKQ